MVETQVSNCVDVLTVCQRKKKNVWKCNRPSTLCSLQAIFFCFYQLVCLSCNGYTKNNVCHD